MVLPYIIYIYILLLLWLVHIVRRVFYCIYFWQLKEYRIDRIKGDIKRLLNVFFPKTTIIAIAVFIFLPIFLNFKIVSWWDGLVLVIFYLFGIYSVLMLIRKKWILPKPTKKSLFLIFLTIIALIYFAVAFLDKFFLFAIVAEIILPLATLLIVEILQIPTFFVKKIIYKKAKNKIGRSKGLKVIGITGSYGKSSTKEFLYTFLSQKYNVLKTSGNVNTEIGVAQTIINKLKPEHQVFIVEMGAYRKGEIKLLCDITKPKIGIVTGVNEQHLALFGSLDNLLSAEGGGELSEALPEDGILVVNGDNKYCLNLYKKTNVKNKKVYSLNNKIINSDIWSDEITIHKNFISFLAIDRQGNMAHFDVNVLGKQNIQNLLGAVLVAKELGMSLEEISEACKNITAQQAGMVLLRGKYGIDVVDSSYSANPDGVFADLDYFSIFPNKKVIVMPCLIELGEKSSEIHKKIGRKIGQVCDLAIITSKDEFKEIEKGFNETKKHGARCLLCDKPQDIYSAITLFCKSGDAVLLEGRVPKELVNLLIG